ncbi:Uncharacterised protein [Leminorella grimontii]|nr:Uncharacterised protein [Leminorella grimontii]
MYISIWVISTHQPYRVRRNIPPQFRLIISVQIIKEPGLLILVLALKAQRIAEAYQPFAGLPVGGRLFFHQIAVGIELAAVHPFAVDVRQAVRRAEVVIVIPVDFRFQIFRQGKFVAVNQRQRAVASRFIQERLPVALVALTLLSSPLNVLFFCYNKKMTIVFGTM